MVDSLADRALPDSLADRALPASLANRYTVGAVLGAGGHAQVVHAYDTALQREVAIKVFRARRTTVEQRREQVREGRLLASLNHRALATLFDIGTDLADAEEPQVYLVMEFIPGGDLRERLEHGALDWFQVCWLGHDLCDALEHLHEAGFLHRDIKPANVLLADHRADVRLRGKLTDFGISSLIGTPQQAGTVTGTAAYIAPEQAEDLPATTASDVYSLGLVLLEALTATRAFPGEAVEAALDRLDRDPLVPVGVPEPLADLLRAMTARDPAARIGARAAADRFRDLAIDELTRRRGPAIVLPPEGEAARLEAVQRYGILDTPPEDAFDEVTAMAARVLRAPIALVSIVDVDRVWFKSRTRFDEQEVDRNAAFWFPVEPGGGPWAVPDTLEDARMRTDPLVADGPRVRAYAAAPLRTHDGHDIGALCVLDRRPRDFSADDLLNLATLARVIMRELELRLASRRIVFGRSLDG